MAQQYEIVLTDEFGSVSYTKEQSEVAAFIAGINFGTVIYFTVNPHN